jgi:exodeoxyribonuclease I
MSAYTFLWHDYETFGIHTQRDRPAQFAAVRTDADLNEIGTPLVMYCRPAPDYLPDPASCLLTGITPRYCTQVGVGEPEFANRIQAALAQPGTIGVGYNSIRFDDEVTRHLLWRNLFDPYAREWQNGCGRWDLLDVLRLCHALRPEGLVWPKKPDGRTSFKLEHLTQANGIAHNAAHDALSDVRATIGLARLLRQKQPKLFEFTLGLRDKKRVMAELGLPCAPSLAKPFLHVSGRLDGAHGHLALMWPLALHPHNRNELLAWDLRHDPRCLLSLSAAEVKQRLFTPKDQLPEGVTRLPIKGIHVNKSPMVVSQLRTLTPDRAAHWGIDMAQALAHAEWASAMPDLAGLWQEVFVKLDNGNGTSDVDQNLYGAFVADADRYRLNKLRTHDMGDPLWREMGFDDPRLPELVFRYRARNFPATLTPEEGERWLLHRQARLLYGQAGALTAETLLARLDELQDVAMERDDEHAESILSELYDYVEAITPEA